MKQKIKKPKNIKKELKPNEFGVLLEEMDSNIKLILEGHSGLNTKIDNLDKNLNTKIDDLRGEMNFGFQAVTKRFEDMDEKIDRNYQAMNSRFKTVFEYLSRIDNEIQSIKSELIEIKSQLKNKADLSFVGTLEKRIKKLEINYLKLRNGFVARVPHKREFA